MREIYEIVRIYKGKVLFLEEHLARLERSGWIIGIASLIDMAQIRKELKKVISAYKGRDGNIKILITEGSNPLYEVRFTPYHFPTEEESKQGVAIGPFRAMRPNPNAKTVNINIRLNSNEMINKLEVYEVILVNEEGEATEGSRSNLFWVKDQTLYSPPLKDVLPGIIRGKVIELAEELAIPFSEEKILYSELFLSDEVFITGTSPGVLPVNQIDDHHLTAPGTITKKIQAAYQQLLD